MLSSVARGDTGCTLSFISKIRLKHRHNIRCRVEKKTTFCWSSLLPSIPKRWMLWLPKSAKLCSYITIAQTKRRCHVSTVSTATAVATSNRPTTTTVRPSHGAQGAVFDFAVEEYVTELVLILDPVIKNGTISKLGIESGLMSPGMILINYYRN